MNNDNNKCEVDGCNWPNMSAMIGDRIARLQHEYRELREEVTEMRTRLDQLEPEVAHINMTLEEIKKDLGKLAAKTGAQYISLMAKLNSNSQQYIFVGFLAAAALLMFGIQYMARIHAG